MYLLVHTSFTYRVFKYLWRKWNLLIPTHAHELKQGFFNSIQAAPFKLTDIVLRARRRAERVKWWKLFSFSLHLRGPRARLSLKVWPACSSGSTNPLLPSPFRFQKPHGEKICLSRWRGGMRRGSPTKQKICPCKAKEKTSNKVKLIKANRELCDRESRP